MIRCIKKKEVETNPKVVQKKPTPYTKGKKTLSKDQSEEVAIAEIVCSNCDQKWHHASKCMAPRPLRRSVLSATR